MDNSNTALLLGYLGNFSRVLFCRRGNGPIILASWWSITIRRREEAGLAFCSSKPGHEGFNATRGFMRYSIKRVARHRSIKSSPDRLGREISAVTSQRRLFRPAWSRHRDWQPRRFHFKYESRSPPLFRLGLDLDPLSSILFVSL